MAAAHGKIGRLIEVFGGDDESPLEQIAGVQAKEIKYGSESVDVTSDDDDGLRRLLDVPGQRQVDISVSGILRGNVIKQWVNDGEFIKYFELRGPNAGEMLAGYFFMANYSESAPYNDKVTFSVELQSDGPWTYTPPS